MAYTKIHPITTTVNKAIKYICNPDKTDDQVLISSHSCSPETAAFDFKFALSKTNQSNKNKAYHLIQSFVPGEVNYDEAHQIGMELAQKHLGEKYSYIVSTHIDKGHIHNHIIFCAADNFEHKKYNDCKRTYYQIRNISDELCEEHNLSVIKECKNIAKSYKEWQEDKVGNSWKTQLRSDINQSIKAASTYDEFLSIIKSKGYEIKDESFNPEAGKYIAFRPFGKERWIRGRGGNGKSLGSEFTKERIKERVEEKEKIRTQNLLKNPSAKGLIDNTKFDSIGLQRWADKENLKRMAHIYATMNEKGFHSMEELDAKISTLQEQSKSSKSTIVTLEKKIRGLAELLNYANQYLENRHYQEKYLKAKNKEAVWRKYEMQLTLYGGAKNMLEKAGIRPQNLDIKKMNQDYQNLLKRKSELSASYKSVEKELKELKLFQQNLQKYLENDKQNVVIKERQSPTL